MKNQKSTIFSLMSIFFIAMGVGTITPAIANIAAAFPEIPFTTILLISTIPSLLVIPSTLITGMVAGTKVKYKTLALIGIALFAISGVAPTFLNSSFTLVLASRVLFGIAIGIISPLGNAIIMTLFDGQSRANMLGIGSLVMNIGGIVLQFLGGTLSGISWELCFLGHLPAVITFILVLLLFKEPEHKEIEVGDTANITAKKEKVPAVIWVISIVFGLTMMLIYPMLMNMSSIMSQVKEIGDATQAAFSLSMYTVGGAISGAIFGKCYKVLKRFIIPVGFFGGAIGFALIIYGSNVSIMTVGTTLTGLFYMLLMPMVMMLIGMYSPITVNALSISILMAVMNAFAFISSYWIALVGNLSGDVFLMPIKIAMIIFVVLAVIFIFLNPMPKKEGSM